MFLFYFLFVNDSTVLVCWVVARRLFFGAGGLSSSRRDSHRDF